MARVAGSEPRVSGLLCAAQVRQGAETAILGPLIRHGRSASPTQCETGHRYQLTLMGPRVENNAASGSALCLSCGKLTLVCERFTSMFSRGGGRVRWVGASFFAPQSSFCAASSLCALI